MSLVIACMDGSSASLRRSHTRMYMSDVVESAALKQTKDYHFKAVKGGLIFNGKSRIRRFILKHNVVTNNLLVVGKSYGGRNIVDLITDLKPILNYDLVYLFLVDACWVGAAAAGHVIQISKVDKTINFYQRNNPGLKGATTSPKAKYEADLTATGCDHFDIIERPEVLKMLGKSIKELCNA